MVSSCKAFAGVGVVCVAAGAIRELSSSASVCAFSVDEYYAAFYYHTRSQDSVIRNGRRYRQEQDVKSSKRLLLCRRLLAVTFGLRLKVKFGPLVGQLSGVCLVSLLPLVNLVIFDHIYNNIIT